MNHQEEEEVVIKKDTLDWTKYENVLNTMPESEFYFYYKGEPPVRTPEFDELVPIDLKNIQTPKHLLHHYLAEGRRDQQSRTMMILRGIALITLQGFRQINWPLLRRSTSASVTDEAFCSFRRAFFTTLTKLVLNLFDIQDFRRAVDQVNINKSCKFLCDHLHELYGTEPESFKRAMVDISGGKLHFNNFPYLREEDIGFTLGQYYMDCLASDSERIEYSFNHVEVKTWPYIQSPVYKRFLVLKHHVSSVIKAMDEYVPLTVEEKRQVMRDLDKDCDNFVWALCLEPWKDIQLQDFDIFESRWLDTIIDPFHLSLSALSERKARVLGMSKKNVMLPLECGVFGKFADEVLDAVGIANLERTRLGQRFLSGKLILSAIHQSSRIAKIVDEFLKEWGGTPMVSKADFLEEEEDRPCYYIYSLAHDVANNLDGDGTVKLEHMVLALVFGRYAAGHEEILGQGCVVGFLKASSSSSSPGKKKLKPTERGELLEDQLRMGSGQKRLDELIRYEKFLLCLSGIQLPKKDRPIEYVRLLNDAFLNKKFDARKKFFENMSMIK